MQRITTCTLTLEKLYSALADRVYETDFSENDRIKVTCHCLYFVLRKLTRG